MPWLDLEEDIAEELGGLVTETRYWAGEGMTLLKSARVGMSRRRCESAPSKYASRVARGLCPCGAARDSEKLRCSRCLVKRRIGQCVVVSKRMPLKLGVSYRRTANGNPAPIRAASGARSIGGTCQKWRAPTSQPGWRWPVCEDPFLAKRNHRWRNAVRWKARHSRPHGMCPRCGRPSAPPRDGVRGTIYRKQCVECLANDRSRRDLRHAAGGGR